MRKIRKRAASFWDGWKFWVISITGFLAASFFFAFVVFPSVGGWFTEEGRKAKLNEEVAGNITKTFDIVKKGIEKTIGPDTILVTKKVLGFGMVESVGSAIMRSLGAFLILYLINLLMVWAGFKFLGRLIRRENEDELLETMPKWLGFVAGRIWKLPIFIGLYLILINLPFINRIISFLLLTPFINSFLFKILILAAWAGLFPSIVEYIMKLRVKFKMERKVMQAKRAAGEQRARAEAISNSFKRMKKLEKERRKGQ